MCLKILFPTSYQLRQTIYPQSFNKHPIPTDQIKYYQYVNPFPAVVKAVYFQNIKNIYKVNRVK